MISVQEAEKIIEKATKSFPAVRVNIQDALGRVLREDIFADRDQPPFNRVTMDGIAVKYSTWKQGARDFTIQGTQPAGVRASNLRSQRHCMEIMTGAMMPVGADTVIPVEKIVTERGVAKLIDEVDLKPEQFIHKQASDYRRGDLLLRQGCLLEPSHIGVLAAVGKNKVKVSRKPRIAVISTGNELVDINKMMIKPFQIRKSNSYALQALFTKNQYGPVKIFHVKDDLQQMRWQMRSILRSFDMMVLSGGVSMGKFDLVPQVLMELGVHVLMHKIAQKPGKPMWFGSSREGKIVFALPGNPVSTQICAYRYILPYLTQASGVVPLSEWGILDRSFYVSTDLTFFAPIEISMDENGRVLVSPIEFSGSGDFTALAHSQGFAEFPAGIRDFARGTRIRISRW